MAPFGGAGFGFLNYKMHLFGQNPMFFVKLNPKQSVSSLISGAVKFFFCFEELF